MANDLSRIVYQAELEMFIEWSATPRNMRGEVRTMQQVSEKLDVPMATLSRWRGMDDFKAEVIKRVNNCLIEGLPDIYQALASSASNPDGRNHSDRELALTMAGAYTPGIAVALDDKTRKLLANSLAPWDDEENAEGLVIDPEKGTDISDTLAQRELQPDDEGD